MVFGDFDWSVPPDILEMFKRGNPRKIVGPPREQPGPEPLAPFTGTVEEIESQANAWAAEELRRIRERKKSHDDREPEAGSTALV